jgi:hypothetical protein
VLTAAARPASDTYGARERERRRRGEGKSERKKKRCVWGGGDREDLRPTIMTSTNSSHPASAPVPSSSPSSSVLPTRPVADPTHTHKQGTRARVPTRTHARTHAHTHIHTHTHTQVVSRTHTRALVCMYVCTCLHHVFASRVCITCFCVECTSVHGHFVLASTKCKSKEKHLIIS